MLETVSYDLAIHAALNLLKFSNALFRSEQFPDIKVLLNLFENDKKNLGKLKPAIE